MTAMCTYRKTKSGSWAVMGPTSAIKVGACVNVTKKSGDIKVEEIESVGKSFVVDGKEMVYGYPAQKETRSARYEVADHEDCLSFGNCGRSGCYG